MKCVDSPFSPKKEIPNLFIPTVSLVTMAPLRLEGQPYDYREYSPTPLDPILLSNADGPRYDQAALDYMDDMRVAHAPEFGSLAQACAWHDVACAADQMPSPTWLSMMREIMAQHELKSRRNDHAIRALRLINDPVNAEEIEEIMQVRAGIASIPTMLRFLAKYPSIGGLEIMKATRPGNVAATLVARAALLNELESLNESGITVGVAPGERRRLHLRSDPELNDIPDPRIVVFKTKLACAAVKLAEETKQLEIVWRDSGVILDPDWDDLSDTYIIGKTSDGAQAAYIAPISVTAYARLAPDSSAR
jgi:hypothetical protein